MMSQCIMDGSLQLRARRVQISRSKFRPGRYKIELEANQFVAALGSRGFGIAGFFPGLRILSLSEVCLDKTHAGGGVIVSLLVLVKLLLALADHGFGIRGVMFLNRKLREREFSFRHGLCVSDLLAERQRLFIRPTRP